MTAGIGMIVRPPAGTTRILLALFAICAFAILSLACMALSADTPVVVLVPCLSVVIMLAGYVTVRAASGSVSAIIACFVVVIFLMDGNFRLRAVGDTGLDWQSLLKFVVWSGSGVIGMRYLRQPGVLARRPAVMFWACYFAVSLISVFGAPSPALSLGYLLSVMSLFMFSIAITERLSEQQILWSLTWTLTVFLIIGWVVVYAYPSLGQFEDLTIHGYRTRIAGIAGQADNLGLVTAIYICVVSLLTLQRQMQISIAIPLAILGLATLVASDSRTGMLGASAGIFAVILSRSKWATLSMAFLGTVGFVGALSFPASMNAFATSLSRSGAPDEFTTLTGRTQIWDFAWQKVLESPFLGWGYNASKFVIGQHVGFEDGLVVDQAHNLLLQNLLSVGLLGTLPLIILFLKFAYDMARGRIAPVAILFIVMVFVTGLTDASAIGTTPTTMTLMFLITSLWPQLADRRHPMITQTRGRHQ